jgi:hypothetical protein
MVNKTNQVWQYPKNTECPYVEIYSDGRIIWYDMSRMEESFEILSKEFVSLINQKILFCVKMNEIIEKIDKTVGDIK